MITVTLFKSIFDTKTNRCIEMPTFEDFENSLYTLSTRERASKKAAELMSPAMYEKGTTRANANVTGWGSWCAVDVDDFAVSGNSLEEELRLKYGHNYYVCYSTASSTKEQPKFRLVFPLQRQLGVDEIKHFWFALNSELGEVGDIQTKDLSRMYYIPGEYKNAFNFIFTNKGEYIDPDALMAKHPYVQKTGNSFFDKLPKEVQDQIVAHRKEKLDNLNVSWTSYRDCPFFPRHLVAEYKEISGTGWYHKMYQIMVALAGNAVKSRYPISAHEIAELCREFDIDNGFWYKSRPLHKEADRALEFVLKNLI